MVSFSNTNINRLLLTCYSLGPFRFKGLGKIRHIFWPFFLALHDNTLSTGLRLMSVGHSFDRALTEVFTQNWYHRPVVNNSYLWLGNPGEIVAKLGTIFTIVLPKPLYMFCVLTLPKIYVGIVCRLWYLNITSLLMNHQRWFMSNFGIATHKCIASSQKTHHCIFNLSILTVELIDIVMVNVPTKFKSFRAGGPKEGQTDTWDRCFTLDRWCRREICIVLWSNQWCAVPILELKSDFRDFQGLELEITVEIPWNRYWIELIFLRVEWNRIGSIFC